MTERRTSGVWQPPPRDKRTGHRISLTPGYHPIQTRKLPWQWKLAEFPMRWLARLAADTYDNRLVTGEEPDSTEETGWLEAGSIALPKEGPRNLGGWSDLSYPDDKAEE